MKRINIISGIVMFAILIASASIVSGEISDKREVSIEEDELWKNHDYSTTKQKFVYEKRSPFVVNEILFITKCDNISVNVEDISRTKARIVLFNVSNGTEYVLVPISLDERQVKTIAINGTKVRIGLIELWRGQNCGFLKTEIMIVKPRTEKE